MAFDPSTASLVETKPSAGEFDPSTATPIEAVSKPVESASGAAFGVYPKPGMKPNDELSRSARNIGRSGIEAFPATAAGLYGFGTGVAAVATPAAAVAAVPVVGPFASATLSLSAGLGTAFVASGAAQKVTDWMHEVFAPEDFAQRKAEKEAHPYEAFAGQTLANLAGMSPRTAPEIAGKFMSKPVVQRATSAALQTGIEAGTEYATEGKVDLIKLGVAATTGVTMPGFNVVGKVPFAAGEKLGQKISSMLPGGTKTAKPDVTSNTDLPPKVDPLSTPEEQAAVIEKLKKISAERNAKVPVVEAAFRDKKSGELLRVGKAHDEQQKIDLADTHEQGFVDENGKFLTRKEAWNRTKSAGQIPENQTPSDVASGLRSKDMRNAGDERFLPTEELVVEPAAPVTEGPKTREEFKTAISNKQADYAELQLKAHEAEQVGQTQQAQEFQTQADAIATEHQQLHKDIPAATFKDAINPTGVEIQDHLWGVKNTGQAIQRMLSVPNLGTKSERLLLEALGKSQFIRSADFNLSKDPLMVDNEPALGAYGIEGKHRIDFDKAGNVGTVIHEVVHAGTMKLMREGNSAAAKKLKALYDQFMEPHEAQYQVALAEKIAEFGGKPSIGQLKAFRTEWMDKRPYGFTNAEEFIAEALINKDMKQLLTSIESKEANGVVTNMWNKIRDAIYEGLGVPQQSRTMLDDVLDNTMTLVKESRNFDKVKDAPSNVLASRLSQEIHDDLQKQGIAVAHSSPHKFGMFNWIMNALKGEGAMAKGAGTYLSTKDSTDKYYFEMSKLRALEKYFENNVDVQRKSEAIEIEQDFVLRKLNQEQDRLTEFENGQLAEAQYYTRRSFEDYVKDKNEYYDAVDPADPATRMAYEQDIATAQRRLTPLKEIQRDLQYKVDQLEADNTRLSAEWKSIVDEAEKHSKIPTYHSTFKAKPEELIDWDATKQSSFVNSVFEKFGIKTESEKLQWTKVGEDRYTATNKDGQNLFLGRRDAGISEGWDVIDSLTGEQLKVSSTLEDAMSANKTGEQLYNELADKFKPTSEQVDAAIKEAQQNGSPLGKEPPWRVSEYLAEIKASIALAEQGVAGNVHNAQAGTETKYRNYVAFDDSKLDVNFVGLAQRPKGADESTAPKSVRDMMREEREMLDPRNVKDEEDFYKIATDIFEKSGDKAALDFYEGYKQYKKTWLEPVAETEKFVRINLQNKLAGERITSNNKAEILDIAAKDKVNLEQLTYKIDRGDKLDGAEKTIADKFRKFMDDLGKRALDAGVINGWHQDYVARNVVSEGDAPKGALEEFMRDIFGKGEGGSGGTKTTTKYGEQRRLKTREDLLNHLDGINGWLAENGKDYRFKLKSDNLADIYADYAHSVEKAIENKNLVTSLKQVRNAAGEALIRPITKDDPLPHGWEVMDNSELAGYAVHPDLKPALGFVFDAGPGKLMEALGTISQVTKRMNVIGSFFHAKSLLEVLSSAQIPIWTPLKEGIVLPLVEKGVKKLTGKELQLSAITKAVDQYRNGGVGDNVDKWIKSTLQLDAAEDVSRGILSSTGKFADTMIGKYGPKTRVLESSLSATEKYTLNLFDKYTWDYLHTGGKIMVADAYLDKARLQAAKEGKPFDEDAARLEIARFVNDSFGGLNWFDAATSTQNEFAKRMAMAAYSPAGRRSLQIVLFAPDWTISTLRAFSAALPKSLNPTKLSPVEGIKGMVNPTTKADYARLYQFKTALTYLTLINTINLMVAGRPVWENKDPTRIEWPDGTSMQAMKHAMEPVHWIMDPDKTLSNKLGFIPKALIVGIAGTEYASPNAPKLVDRSATNRLATAAQGALPFQVSAAKDAPKGEGAKRALLGTMGFPVYGSTPEQRKLKNAERELQTKELAWKYRDKEIKAGREKMTPEHIKQGNTLTKRRAELNEKLGK